MKIRVKLILFLLASALIPLLILFFYSNNNFSKLVCDSHSNDLKVMVYDKSLYISEFMINLTGDIKVFSSDKSICEYVDSCSENGYSDNWDDAEYVNEKIRQFMKKNSSVSDMFVLDKRGTIIASHDKNLLGSPCDQFEEFTKIASENNGISGIYPPYSGNGNYFYIVRRIYSDNNTGTGLACEKIDMSSVCDFLKISGFSNYGQILLIDSDGKYITNSTSTPKRLDIVSEFRNIAVNLKDVIPFYSSGNSVENLSSSYDNYIVHGSVVSAANWCVIGFFDSSLALKSVSASFSSTKIILFIMLGISAAAIIFICFRFTSPISSLLNAVKKVSRGDTNFRLKLDTNDEYNVLGANFNTMIDNIYESDQRYRAVISMLDNVVFEVNLISYKVYVTNNFNQKFSYRAADDSFGESFLNKLKVHKDDNKRYHEDLNKIVASTGEKWEGEYRLRNIYGDFSWVRIHARKFYDRNNSPTKIIGMLVDIDREKKSAINLMQKANYDALTQLYNRATFLRALDEEMQLSVSRRSLDALMFIDLDDFKHFNDEFGHKCGDEVLKFVADTIKELTFDAGFGGRLGGDEFVMCITNLTLIGNAGQIAAELIKTLNNGFISESTGNKFNIHCSIGIAFFRENGGNSTELLEAADAAMYKIKKSGKSNYAFAGDADEDDE